MTSREIKSIEGVIEFADGEKVDFSLAIDTDGRWGSRQEVLGRAVEPCEIIHRNIYEAGLWHAPGGDAEEEA